MPKDWRAITRSSGLDISPSDLDRIVPPLEALEESFRPLVKDLMPGMEPDVAFTVEESQ